MVRAGERAYLIDDFIDNGIIAVGWNDLGELSDINNLEEIKALYEEIYSNDKKHSRNMNAGQIYRFTLEFKIEDYVITYKPNERIYWLGKIKSDYYYDENLITYFHLRKVEWQNQINRDDLTVKTKNSLGSIASIFEIQNPAKQEILNAISGETTEEYIEDDENLDLIQEDFSEKAHEFIKDKILELDWEEMQELVASLMRSMGYKTRISPAGSDRGKDIVASPDGLGLEDPRILIEVKHRLGTIGSQDLRSFIGGIRQGDKGVYFSSGGFTKDSKYEADRANIPITLIDSDFLVELILQNYDNFDPEGKALIPLRKVYWPI